MLLSGILYAENIKKETATVQAGPNFRIFPSDVTQTETFITRHPLNHQILFVSANTLNLSNGFISEGIYLSTNGGADWFGSDVCSGEPVAFHRGDPGIAIDDEGRLILIRLGFSPGLYSHFSTDNGATWSLQQTVVENDQDRATLVADPNPDSEYFGRAYAFWVRFAQPFPVFFAYTDDGAATWSAPQQINNPQQRSLGGETAVGPDGSVHVTWAGVISTSPFTEDFAGYARSTDGGANWNVQENAFDTNGIAGIFSEKGGIRVNGLPRIDVDKSDGPRQGWVYIVTTESGLAPAGNDPDIILHRSTDGGDSWSGGIRVNQDALNNGKTQYFPAIHVDDMGGINIIYYDDRTTSNDSTGVFLSRSVDGGNSWSDTEISDHHFKPSPIGGLGQGYQGDNISLTSSGNTLWPVWMDNASGVYQIWSCPIALPTVSITDPVQEIPEAFQLLGNYPNPFNPTTNIRYSLSTRMPVKLEVFDLYGKRIALLVDAVQNAGEYTVNFSSSSLPGKVLASGKYFYRLSAKGVSQTKSMLLLK